MEKFSLLFHLMLATCLLVFQTTASPGWAAEQDNARPQKRAQPSAKSYSAALKLIKNAFQEDLRDRSRAGCLKTAQKLIDIAPEENDLDVRFTILDQARQLATQNGSFSIAWDAIQKIDAQYQVDLRKTLMADVKDSLKKMPDVNAFTDSLPAIFEIVDTANNVDDFKFSLDILDQVSRAGRRTRDELIVQQIDFQKKQTLDRKELFENFEKSLSKLKSNPNDSRSLLAVGNYLCFVKNDFPSGLPYLARMSKKEPGLNRAVQAQINLDETPETQANAGVYWFEVSQKDKTLIGVRQKEHAAELLGAALTDATGLLKKEIERHLTEVNAALAADQGQGQAADIQLILSRTWNVSWSNTSVMKDVKFDPGGTVSWKNSTGNTVKTTWKIENNAVVAGGKMIISYHFHVLRGQVVASQVLSKSKQVKLTRVCQAGS